MNKLKGLDVAVIGMGYVGLTLSIVMAEAGINITGIEKNQDIYNKLCSGESHFFETGIQKRLALLLEDEKEHGHGLHFAPGIAKPADVWIITVGTPLKSNEKAPTLAAIKDVTSSIGQFLKKGDLVIARSTVPIGTTREIVVDLLQNVTNMVAGTDFYVAFAPERTIEGAALQEIRNLPQIIGGINRVSAQLAKVFFERFVDETVLAESLEAAEMVKLIDNSYRDFIFSYSNYMSTIANALDIDFSGLVKMANYKYERNKIPCPSPGVGGACLSKDSYLLDASTRKAGRPADYILHGRTINEQMPQHVLSRLLEKLKDNALTPDIASVLIVGVAFKGAPATSDIRNSVTLDYIKLLFEAGFNKISAYDQYVDETIISSLDLNYVSSLKEGIANANVILFLNNNPNYEDYPIYSYLASAQKPMIFFDGWGQFDNEIYRNINGVCYLGL